MSDLTHDAPIGTTQLRIDTRLDETPPFSLKVDDELLFVGGVDYRDGLTLALAYPTTATHSAGTEVVPVLDAYTTDDSSPFATGTTEQTVLGRTATLTNAQVKALGLGTAVEVVPAPGAGVVLVPTFVWISVDATAGPYTGISGSATLSPCWVGGSDIAPMSIAESDILVSGLLGAPNDEPSFAVLTGTPWVFDRSEGENLPLGLNGWNGGDGEFTGGHVSNTFKVTIAYTVLEL